MWFYKQAQQVSPAPQREVERRIEPRIETRQEAAVIPIVPTVEEGMQAVERKIENIVQEAGPVTDWFMDVVQPLERKLEATAEEKTEVLLDKNGWWIDETRPDVR